MRFPAGYQSVERPRRVVLTGGPGAGKTAVLELVKQQFCQRVRVVQESASLVFGGGFPRRTDAESRGCSQRAIFHVQQELERLESGDAVLVLCDRGTLDGLAYWPFSEQRFWDEVRSSREEQLARYDTVIHLRTPSAAQGYNHANALRTETAEQTAALDARIVRAWDGHPRRAFVESTPDFLGKAQAAITLLMRDLPACCTQHLTQLPPGQP